MVNTEFVALLEQAGIPDADFEIRCIMEQFTGNRTAFSITPEQRAKILSVIQRRIAGEPLQYLLGEWEFYGLRIFVGEGVLIPRPETELLTDTILHECKNRKNLKIMDLCTGSGCIALALKSHLPPDTEISAVDISKQALHYAEKNKAYHHLAVNLFHADVLNPDFVQQFQNLDVIVSNPPYLTEQEMHELQPEVQHEPALALSGVSTDGTYFYQKITSLWKNALNPGGMLAFEIGWQQGTAVSQILEHNGFRKIQVIQDYEHRDRVVTGEKI